MIEGCIEALWMWVSIFIADLIYLFFVAPLIAMVRRI